MADPTQNKRNEEGRILTLQYLYTRGATALDVPTIQSGLKRHKGWEATEAEIKEWLAFWLNDSSPKVKLEKPAWGSTAYYQILPAGLLLIENE